MIRNIAALLYLAVALTAPHAEAQNPQPAAPSVVPAPMAPSNSPSPPPEQIAPPGNDVHVDSGKQTLSDRLALHHGTLEPPHGVDPGMAISPPAGAQGTMPVIPPPGSPGGNQQVVPK